MKQLINKFMAAIVILSLPFTIVQAQQTQEVFEFDLHQCIDYALENNVVIKNAKLNQDISDAQVKEYTAIGLPQVNINSGLNYNYEVQRSLMDISNFDPQVPKGTEKEVAFGQKYDGNVVISAKQLIFDGSFFVGLQAAKTVRELSSKQFVKSEIDVAQNVAKAYYNLLVREEQLLLLEKNSSRFDSLLNDVKKMHDQGFIEKIDLSRVQVQVNNLKVQLDNATKYVALSKDLLKFQMGMLLASDLKITEKISDITFDQPELMEKDFSYNERIEYSELQTNLLLVNLDMKSTKMQFMPSLYAQFNYGYNTSTADGGELFTGNRWLNFGVLGATLAVPVFDGFQKRSKIQRNKLQIQQLENNFDLLENSIDLEIKQAKINVSNSVESMKVQQQNMGLAEEVFRITEIKYKEGVGSNSEVLDADKALKEAQTNYYNALYEALVSKIDLDKAYGTLLKN